MATWNGVERRSKERGLLDELRWRLSDRFHARRDDELREAEELIADMKADVAAGLHPFTFCQCLDPHCQFCSTSARRCV